MGRFVTVAKVADVAPGAARSVEAEGFGIALFNVEGRIFALDNTCPHAGGPLGEGQLQGGVVRCPWHGWRFSVVTGERPENPAFKVGCYQVEVEGDEVRVWLPPDFAEGGLSPA